MRNLSKKAKTIIAGAAIVGLASAGGAYAYWTTTGSGSGTATTGTSSDFAVATEAPTGGPLTPGGPLENVEFTVTNNNTGVQHLNGVTVTVANSDGTDWAPTGVFAGCSAADYSIGTITITPGDIASDGHKDGDVNITMNNLGHPQDFCKNAPVPLYVHAS